MRREGAADPQSPTSRCGNYYNRINFRFVCLYESLKLVSHHRAVTRSHFNEGKAAGGEQFGPRRWGYKAVVLNFLASRKQEEAKRGE